MNDSDGTKNKGRKTTGRPVVSLSQLRYILMGAIGTLFLNNLMISSSTTRRLENSGDSQMISSDFYSTSNRRLEKQSASESTLDGGPKLLKDDEDLQLLRKPRILMGIFSSDSIFDGTHRTWHRHLFSDIWKDERVCTLHQFRSSNDTSFQQKCQLIYTFVAGANGDPNAPTERLEETDTPDTPIELPGGLQSPMKEDVNWPDVTHLNIL